jgi:aminopeptidase N
MKIADEYLEESRRLYKRPLVTTIYKHPDDLFDSHSYEKGGCILHMLRNDIGDNNFRRCINNYLNTYKNKTSETDDLRKIVEDVSRKSMRRFFDQWVYRSGHPQLDIEFSLEEEDSRRIKIKIRQIHQEDDGSSNTDRDNPNCCNLFEFTLDIRIVFSTTADIEINNKLEAIYISQRITEHSIEIPKDARIEWISIDPQFKILKEIKSIKITNETNEFQLKEMLKKQLCKGKTIIERIEAARALKNQYSEDVVDELHNAVIVDPFYGVSIEAANTLGSYHEKNNYAKANKAYVALFSCLNKEEEIFSRLHPEIKQAIVRNIGQFEREESINLLESLLHLQNESYFLRANAATAIGKSSKNKISSLDNIKKEKIISLLKEIVIISKSFRNVIANGAIDGLKEFSKDKDKDIVVDIANFLIHNTNSNNEYFKRLAATSALSKFLRTIKDNDDEKNTKLEEMNQKVFNHLLGLLKDKRQKVKINACKAFADNDAKPARPDTKIFEAIDALIYVAEHDLDGFIRREAERCVNIMREWIKEWSSKPPTLDIKLRKEQIS